MGVSATYSFAFCCLLKARFFFVSLRRPDSVSDYCKMYAAVVRRHYSDYLQYQNEGMNSNIIDRLFPVTSFGFPGEFP